MVLVHNVQDGTVCLECAPPSFSPRNILTLEDLRFMEACGVDPGLSPALRSLLQRVYGRWMNSKRPVTPY